MAGSGSAASTWQGLCREPRGIQRLPTGLDAWSHHIIRLGRVSIVLLAALPGSVLHKHYPSRPDSKPPTEEKQRAWHSGSYTSGKCMTLHARTTMIHDTRRQSVDDKVHRNSTYAAHKSITQGPPSITSSFGSCRPPLTSCKSHRLCCMETDFHNISSLASDRLRDKAA